MPHQQNVAVSSLTPLSCIVWLEERNRVRTIKTRLNNSIVEMRGWRSKLQSDKWPMFGQGLVGEGMVFTISKGTNLCSLK